MNAYNHVPLGELSKKVLQSNDDLFLLKVSSETWIDSYCLCMKSTFEANVINSSIRTIDCYSSYTVSAGANIILKRSDRIEFYVKEIKGAIVIELVSVTNGKPYCMLWGLHNEKSKNEQGCFRTIERDCVPDLFRVWDYSEPCLKHDDLSRQAHQAIAEQEA
ncbi:hypothetical protein V5799_005841 [Amblyomma americanum]|uniref:Uncharacterized protein n=1 Tax=Amblyomma americanum TaxID=6943 RepID=A0AAQ4DY37_AMBAM